MKTPTKTTAHSVYNLNYHIVLVTKYRNRVLTDDIARFVEEQVPTICRPSAGSTAGRPWPWR